jgi:hypothetical protein
MARMSYYEVCGVGGQVNSAPLKSTGILPKAENAQYRGVLSLPPANACPFNFMLSAS